LPSHRFRSLRIALFPAALSCLPLVSSAQTSTATDDTGRTTLGGVYTAAQASRGTDVFAASCMGCHTTASHTGPAFMGPWSGKPVAELFQFIRYFMPKSEPGTLSVEEYAQLTAYILQLNGMPDGARELPADSASLSLIRIARRNP
jgi:mono/diheme cytochrome c family protein